MPDFEKPAASNNVYRVTVKVSDGKGSDTRDVTVTVTDMAEDGVATLSSVQPKVAVPLTASLEDSDGGVKDITWQWYNDTIDTNSLATNAIDKATSATYTPVADDVGDTTLSVRASYTDRRGEDSATITAAAGVILNNDNRAPMFPDTETGVRKVAEGTAADMPIGDGTADNDTSTPPDHGEVGEDDEEPVEPPTTPTTTN